MLGPLELTPMTVMMLLLYGILLALVLVAWSALSPNRDKSANRQDRQAAPKQAKRPAAKARPADKPVQATQVPAEPIEASPVAPAAQPRRTADSDSVVSYSVRQRVSTPPPADPPVQPRPEPQQQPARREPEVRPAAVNRPANQEFQVGRAGRLPHAPENGSQANGQDRQADRQKGEDAFERFLRSSTRDNEDY